MGIVTKRSELLFCYDIKDANPNGDPLDENKPRMDEETGINIVTDVRLKRTIRDYLFDCKGYNGQNGKDIFVREVRMETGGIQDGKTRAKNFNENPANIIEKCIDVRLFGGVIPLEKKKKQKKEKNKEETNEENDDKKEIGSIKFTGPVQFKMGRSLNQVSAPKHIKGTGAFASEAGKEQRTFRDEYILPYSFICFYGIINENAAKHTQLTDDDINLLIEAIWNGTKNLISRSKFGQMPRFLLKVNYKEPNFFIGDLDSFLKIECENEAAIRDIGDFKLKTDHLFERFIKNIEKIESIEYKVDENLRFEIHEELKVKFKALTI